MLRKILTCSASYLLAGLACLVMVTSCSNDGAAVVERPATDCENVNYVINRAPLVRESFIKLPVADVQPDGWVREYLLRQKDGLTGHLGEISKWLEKDGNAWLSKGGDHGWEELPYWLKGYGDLSYILGDEEMINETMVWIEGALSCVAPDGYFGPVNYFRNSDTQELWAQMIMLWCLQSYYEYSGDGRVLELMTNYFKWQLTVPDENFLTTYWENSRAGDNLLSVYWLYNRTGEEFLMELAEKIHRNTAIWYNPATLPNWHNVNIAQCFREPAEYYSLVGDSTMLQASYNAHNLIRRAFGQVPGGMFGADENARLGYVDPRQGIETCGIVEQMNSDEIMLRISGDPFWAEHCEEVAFNTFPAAVMPDFKALRYITCPNHVVSDSENHNPGIDNRGPFLSMNPFSSRCCQHNHSFGWPYYVENLLYATQDNGVAAVIYSPCHAKVKVADGREITLTETTNYPFEEEIRFTVGMGDGETETNAETKVQFPLYLRIPSWTAKAKVLVNGKPLKVKNAQNKYVRIERQWSDGDEITLKLPMSLSMRVWQVNKNSVSVNYGPLTLSLKISEDYVVKDSREGVMWDSGWREEADPKQWPTTEIYPASPWNYALILDKAASNPLRGIEVIRKDWPQDNFPFTLESVPLEFKINGRRIPSWTIDETGLCGVLPNEDAPVSEEVEELTLIPMGAARLRISAFPSVGE